MQISKQKYEDSVITNLVDIYLNDPLSTFLAPLFFKTWLTSKFVTLLGLISFLSGALIFVFEPLSPLGIGVIGVLLFEFGILLDGIDGKLAKLRGTFDGPGGYLDQFCDSIGRSLALVGMSIYAVRHSGFGSLFGDSELILLGWFISWSYLSNQFLFLARYRFLQSSCPVSHNFFQCLVRTLSHTQTCFYVCPILIFEQT